jgi:hypothetical protein
VEEHRRCISSILNLSAINRLERKAANILGTTSKVPESNSLFYAKNVQETDSNMTFLEIIKFLLQALVSLV